MLRRLINYLKELIYKTNKRWEAMKKKNYKIFKESEIGYTALRLGLCVKSSDAYAEMTEAQVKKAKEYMTKYTYNCFDTDKEGMSIEKSSIKINVKAFNEYRAYKRLKILQKDLNLTRERSVLINKSE